MQNANVRILPALRRFITALSGVALSACVSTSGPAPEGEEGLAVPWVRNSVEYRATALQTYQIAGRHLEEFVADRSWSALPNQTDAAGKPPAIILDVDETVLDNSLYQEREGGEYDPATWDEWIAERIASAVPGVAAFLQQARDLGVTPFFVTNRPCRPRDDMPDPCPQDPDTLANLADLAIEADDDHLMLLGEEVAWGREKESRRMQIAAEYRVIMLFGDQLGDFVTCARRSAEAPCTVGATAGSRRALYLQHAQYWGRGWYMLPNPMYGSWAGF